METVKENLQRLHPLETKVDAMVEKLSLLERLEKTMQRWEDFGRVTVFEYKEKGIFLRGPNFGMAAAPLKRARLGLDRAMQRRWEPI